MKKQVVLSVFNGMSTGRTALEEEGFIVDKYYSSEIKKIAISFTQEKYPDTIHLGCIKNWRKWDIDFSKITLILSGSPCQDLSIAGKRVGLSGERSSLFFVFVDILNHVKKLNPKVLFLQENVGSATKLDVGIMSRALGVYPCKINSSKLTAQLRDRYYWTNIKTKKFGMFGDIISDIPQPKDLKIKLQDILTSGYSKKEKHCCLKTKIDSGSQEYLKRRERKTGMVTLIQEKNKVRVANKIEMCKLQGFDGNYCDSLSESQACNLLGDGWTLPVIRHIFSFIKS